MRSAKRAMLGCVVAISCAIASGAVAQTCTPGPASPVRDGSFESGIPSTTWIEGSDARATVLCDADSCGGINWARNGTIWVYFGATDGTPELGYVEQSITIPPGTDTLSFGLWISRRSGNGSDLLRVLIDGTPVREFLEGEGPYADRYAPINLDVSAFADGGTHLLRFESSISGVPENTSFFIDDIALCTDPCTPLTPEPVADPSFEGGSPSADWDEYSLLFGTPICDASCATPPVAGALSGDWFVWFGGAIEPEDAYVEQVLTIPATANTLSFNLSVRDRSENGTDYVRALVDGATVFEILESDPTLGFVTHNVDISAWADGGPHTLSFESAVTGVPESSSFFLDDVSVRACVAPPDPDVLRNASITSLYPVTPARGEIFTGSGGNTLDPARDAYATEAGEPWSDPDPVPVLGDRTRPLVFYQLVGAATPLLMAKTGGDFELSW